MFNVKRRDYPSTDKYTDIKKAPFGGPSEKVDFDTTKRTTLAGYQRIVSRNADFEGGNFNHNYDPTWKAITRDLIHRSANKKEFNPMYAKPTMATVPAVEEGRIARFEEYVNENFDGSGFNMFSEAEDEPEVETGMESEMEPEMEPEVDEEKLEALMEDYSETITDVIEEIMKQMEIEREETIDLLRAALKKMKEEPAEEEEEEEEEVSEMPEAREEEE